jgi:uncharacterized metal-binding protein YceD (DUF177 family)
VSESAILSRPVEVAEVPAAGLEVDITASEQECAALAAANGLVAVHGLSAATTLTRDGKGGISLEGRVVADIVQTCVVSLVPFEQHIDEPISVRFVAPGSAEAPKPPKAGAEVVISPDQPEPPELLTGPTIDVGALAEEYFVLAIDPYPRAPGAVLPAEAVDTQDEHGESPFAALAGLATKRPPKG